jgi:hypothetical protein
MLGYSNARDQGLSKDIWGGTLKVRYAEIEEGGYYDQNKPNEITITNQLLGGDAQTSALLATMFSHEGTHAYGSRIEAEAHENAFVTYATICERMGLARNELFMAAMYAGMMADGATSANTGDKDFWKLVIKDGRISLVDDGKKDIVDQYGNLLASHDPKAFMALEAMRRKIADARKDGRCLPEDLRAMEEKLFEMEQAYGKANTITDYKGTGVIKDLEKLLLGTPYAKRADNAVGRFQNYVFQQAGFERDASFGSFRKSIEGASIDVTGWFFDDKNYGKDQKVLMKTWLSSEVVVNDVEFQKLFDPKLRAATTAYVDSLGESSFTKVDNYAYEYEQAAVVGGWGALDAALGVDGETVSAYALRQKRMVRGYGFLREDYQAKRGLVLDFWMQKDAFIAQWQDKAVYDRMMTVSALDLLDRTLRAVMDEDPSSSHLFYTAFGPESDLYMGKRAVDPVTGEELPSAWISTYWLYPNGDDHLNIDGISIDLAGITDADDSQPAFTLPFTAFSTAIGAAVRDTGAEKDRTKPGGYGYHITGYVKGMGFVLGHLQRGSAAHLQTLLDAARSARLPYVTLPAGVQIGNMGSTGNSSGPHFHWELRRRQWLRYVYW